MEVIYITSAVTSLIVLICFFVLCWNVGQIKSRLKSVSFRSLKDLYERHKYFGNNAEALMVYEQMIWIRRNEIIQDTGSTEETKKKELGKLPQQFPYLEQLGGHWPEDL